MDRKKTTRLVGTTVVIGLVIALAVYKHKVIVQSLKELSHINLIWVPVACAFAVASLFAAARIHRRLLNASGENVSVRPMAAITFAGNAISVSIPIAGTELSTAFTFEQFRERGIDAAKAVWALTSSGVASAFTFGLLVVIGALISANTAAVIGGLSTLAVATAGATILIVSLRNDVLRKRVIGFLVWVLRGSKRVIHRPQRDPLMVVVRAFDQIASLRIERRQWLPVFGAAMWNWIADLLCFIVCIHAVGASVPWAGVILAYSAGAGTNSLGLVPGGVGLVEVALSAALVKSGVPSSYALSAVLAYRIISFWLVTALGWLVFVILRRRNNDEHQLN